MRCTDNPVHDIGVLLNNGRQGVDHGLETLAGAEQSESHHHAPPRKAELDLVLCFAAERTIGRTMGDDRDPAGIDLIKIAQEQLGVPGHYHHARSTPQEMLKHGALLDRRLGQHRMQRNDQWRGHAVDQIEDHVASIATEYPVLML